MNDNTLTREVDAALSDLCSPERVAAAKAIYSAGFEERVMKTLLTGLGLADGATAIRAVARDRYGKDRLDFTSFREVYPSFPVWVSPQRISYVHRLSLPSLYRLAKTKIFSAWEEAASACCEEDMAVAIVFRVARIPGYMTFHNLRADFHSGDGWWLVVRVKHQYYCLESFKNLLRRVEMTWSPV